MYVCMYVYQSCQYISIWYTTWNNHSYPMTNHINRCYPQRFEVHESWASQSHSRQVTRWPESVWTESMDSKRMCLGWLVYPSSCWLVVSTPVKNMKLNWDDYSQYMEKLKLFQISSKPPTSQQLFQCLNLLSEASKYQFMTVEDNKNNAIVLKNHAMCGIVRALFSSGLNGFWIINLRWFQTQQW